MTIAGTGLGVKSFMFDPVPATNPTTFSVECWFRTRGQLNGLRGVTLIDFGAGVGGNAGSYDRRMFVDTGGHLGFGTTNGTTTAATSSSTYADGAWHYAVATVSPSDGISLYADGRLVATATYAAPSLATGYWRFGGDTWNAAFASDYLVGGLDEVAVYPSVLSAQQVAWHYHADH